MDARRSDCSRRQAGRAARSAAAAVSALLLALLAPVRVEATITELTKGTATFALAANKSTIQLRSGSFNDYAGGPHPAGSGYVTLQFCSKDKCSGPDNLSVEIEIVGTPDPYVQSLRVSGPGTSISYVTKGACTLRAVRFNSKGVEGSCTCEGPNQAKVPMGGPLSSLTFTATR